jgi:hypothetical protein
VAVDLRGRWPKLAAQNVAYREMQTCPVSWRRGRVERGLAMRVRVVVGVGAAALTAATMFAAGGVMAEEPNICVSVNGGDQVRLGTAECSSIESDGAANVAIARADGAYAEAGSPEVEGDSGNRARASGDGSVAIAYLGDDNMASASGEGSFAAAVGGDGNTASASGDESYARAAEGDGNWAIASGDGSWAEAADGDGNTAIASGEGSADGKSDGAYAVGGDSNTAIASGDYSYAFAGAGDRNTAIAAADGCEAEANSGNDITVVCP